MNDLQSTSWRNCCDRCGSRRTSGSLADTTSQAQTNSLRRCGISRNKAAPIGGGLLSSYKQSSPPPLHGGLPPATAKILRLLTATALLRRLLLKQLQLLLQLHYPSNIRLLDLITLATPGDEAHQPKARQQHRVSFRLGYWGGYEEIRFCAVRCTAPYCVEQDRRGRGQA